MGKTKAQQWKKLADPTQNATLMKQLRQHEQVTTVRNTNNADLFFVDKTGQAPSAVSGKKRAREASEDGVKKKEEVQKAPAPSAAAPPSSSASKSAASSSSSSSSAPASAPASASAASSASASASSASSNTTKKARVAAAGRRRDVDEEPAGSVPTQDLWAAEKPAPKKEGLDTFLVDMMSLNKPKLRRKKQTDAYITKERLAVAPSGTSVNPDPKAHKALLQVAEERARRDLERAQKLEDKLSGASVDWAALADPAYDPDAPSDDERAGAERKPVQVQHRTQAEKNRLSRKKATEQALARAKREKSFNKSIDKLPEILKEIQAEAAAREAEKKRQEELRSADTRKHKKMSKHAFEPAFPEVMLEEEAAATGGSLRATETSHTLVTDAFKRLQERNLLDVRKRQKPTRRYKLKEYERSKRESVAPVEEVVKSAELRAKKVPSQRESVRRKPRTDLAEREKRLARKLDKKGKAKGKAAQNPLRRNAADAEKRAAAAAGAGAEEEDDEDDEDEEEDAFDEEDEDEEEDVDDEEEEEEEDDE